MISDGVAADGSEWITKLIRSWRGDAQGLAEELTAAALSRRKGKRNRRHDGDMRSHPQRGQNRELTKPPP